jgi:hypothetical protein
MEKKAHSLDVLCNLRMNLGIGALQVGMRVQRWPAVSGTGNVNHTGIPFLDQPVQVYINEVLPCRGAPVS